MQMYIVSTYWLLNLFAGIYWPKWLLMMYDISIFENIWYANVFNPIFANIDVFNFFSCVVERIITLYVRQQLKNVCAWFLNYRKMP